MACALVPSESECAICYTEQPASAMTLLVCGHSFCTVCLQRWIARRPKATCPSCRVLLLPALRLSEVLTERMQTCVVDLSDGKTVGITLSSVGDSTRILVTDVLTGKTADRAGIRVGDVLRSVQGVGCVSHQHAIGMIDLALRARMTVTLTLTPHRTCFDRCLPRKRCRVYRA